VERGAQRLWVGQGLFVLGTRRASELISTTCAVEAPSYPAGVAELEEYFDMYLAVLA
jgi:hypothetical protein